MLELYADTAPACGYVHKVQAAQTVLTLGVDWHKTSKAAFKVPAARTKETGSSHIHQKANLDYIDEKELRFWTVRHWNVEPHEVDWIHVSFNCTTQSQAGAARPTHRTTSGAPRTEEAHTSDATIAKTLDLLEQIRARAPGILITCENPRLSIFDRHLTVRSLINTGKWCFYYSSHCKTATANLDGKVTPDNRCPNMFPQKDSIWLITGLQRHDTLSECRGDCRMLIPDTQLHFLIICRPAAGLRHPLQRVMSMNEQRGRIPLGAMHEIFAKHQTYRALNDLSDKACARCGSAEEEEGNPLLICDEPGCTKIQHLWCSGIARPEDAPNLWRCDACAFFHRPQVLVVD